MEWISSMLGFGASSSSSSDLQTAGAIDRDTLMQFFARGRELFASRDFSAHLRQGFNSGKNVEEMINKAQGEVRAPGRTAQDDSP